MEHKLDAASRRIFRGVFFLATLVVVATLVYVRAGFSLVDALYMVVITVFSVGYGEVQELGPGLRVFTMFVIVGGCSSLVYITSGLFQMIAEGQLEKALGRRSMDRDIAQISEHAIVCGYGRIGHIVCQELLRAKLPVVVIDADHECCEAARAAGFLVIHGDATSDAVLKSAGLERARALASVLSSDALNVFITLTARQLRKDLLIVARGEEPTTEPKLLQAGADRVVLPSRIGAERVAHIVTRPSVLEFFAEADLGALAQELSTIGVEIDQFEVTGDSRVIGLSVGQLESSGSGGFMVVAVQRVGGSLIKNPTKEFTFAEEDKVLLMGHKEDLPDLTQRFAVQVARLTVRGAVIRSGPPASRAR